MPVPMNCSKAPSKKLRDRYNAQTTWGDCVKYLLWLLRAALFFTLFAFSLNNQAVVQVNLFFGTHWQAPLVWVLWSAMLIGVVLGVAIMLPLWLHAKRAQRPATAPVATNTDTTPLPPHGI